MATLRKVPVEWTTGPGGSGLSVFYTQDPADATAALGTFFNAIKGVFPSAVTWSIPSSGDTIDSDTGRLNGSWSGGTAAVITGSGAGNYAAGTGCYVRWYTNTVYNGRKFMGRTFLVPLLTGGYDSTGTIDNSNLSTLQTAVNTLVSSSALVIYKRPPKGTFAGGTYAEQTSGLIPDKVTSLKSRRS